MLRPTLFSADWNVQVMGESVPTDGIGYREKQLDGRKLVRNVCFAIVVAILTIGVITSSSGAANSFFGG